MSARPPQPGDLANLMQMEQHVAVRSPSPSTLPALPRHMMPAAGPSSPASSIQLNDPCSRYRPSSTVPSSPSPLTNATPSTPSQISTPSSLGLYSPAEPPVRALPVPPDRTGFDKQRADLEQRRLDQYDRRKREAREQFIGQDLPQWMRDDPSAALPEAPVVTKHLSTLPHAVTVLPDREGKWKGKMTKCTVLCKWKAIAIRAADRKMGAKTVQKVTLVIDGLAFKEETAGFAPPSDTTIRYAEQSVDMAVLIHQLDRIWNHLQNPHARLAWAMDSTPAFGKDRQVTSVLTASVEWGEVNQHDGLPGAKICTDLTILPVQVVLGKNPSAAR